ncbi:hypothetical protein [Agromyces salentinus]|nr:hypothetical protein [Agromyces salentinus]
MQLLWYLAGQRPELALLRESASRRARTTPSGLPEATHRSPSAATSSKEH